MLVFTPISLGEVVSLGKGVSAADGHSLHLKGVLYQENSEVRTFCNGHLRIQERTPNDNDHLGVAQITNIDGAPHFSAALIVERNDFSDIRDMLLRKVEKLQIQLEDVEYKTPTELASAGTIVRLVAASVRGEYSTTQPKIRG
jgi:hypothetical protein